jgi:hypothetical protein
MADDGVIAAYLRELRFSVAQLADADDIVAESEDHLLEAVERLVADGRSHAEAESEALARFGSAALISKVCLSEAKRGAAVPTTKTRLAGLAAMLAPVFVLVGQLGNLHTGHTFLHGAYVAMLTLAFPLFLFGLWGLRARHGGLGSVGRWAWILAIGAPVLSFAAAYAAIFALAGLLAVALLVFVVQMLRASVLPVAPLVLLGVGPVAALATAAVALVVSLMDNNFGNTPGLALAVPIVISSIGFMWLGAHLFMETAANHRADGVRNLAF